MLLKRTYVLLLGLTFIALLSLFVLNASRVGPLETCLSECAEPPISPPSSYITFASLNMLHEFPHFNHLNQRVDLIAEEMKRINVDVICLQEVPWTLSSGSVASHLSDILGMNYAYLPANGNIKTIAFSEGVAILSAFEISGVRAIELLPRDDFFEHRVALSAIIRSPLWEIGLVCTHLTNGSSVVNQRQVDSLIEFAGQNAGIPTIVAGDFNATEQLPQIQKLANIWIDVYRLAHPADPGFTCCRDDLTKPADMLTERIDYIFLIPGKENDVRVVSTQVVFNQPFRIEGGWLWASDHAGLYAVFGFLP